MMVHTRTNKALAIKIQTDMYPQVHKPHVYITQAHVTHNRKIAFLAWRQSTFTYFKNSSDSESPVCPAARGRPICTTGSQQPNSCRPSPAKAVVQTLREIAAFALHPDHTHIHTHTHAQSREPSATWFKVRKDSPVALCLGPNLDEDTKQR